LLHRNQLDAFDLPSDLAIISPYPEFLHDQPCVAAAQRYMVLPVTWSVR
jgi:hypothetical protein